VDLDTRGRSNVVVGVSHPEGSFFGAPLQLNEKANLFWLSPGGIWLGKGARFAGASNLLLSTSPTMRFGGKDFDVLTTTASEALRLDQGPDLDLGRLARGDASEGVLGAGVGPIVLAGGRLRVDRNLLIDSGVGPIRSELGTGPTRLEAGESVTLVGGSLAVSQALLRGSNVLVAGAVGLQLDQVTAQAATSSTSASNRGGRLQLIAGNDKKPGLDGSQSGSVSISNSNLEAHDIRMRANGSIGIQNVRATAGSAGDRGLIQIETVTGSGQAHLEGADLEARRIVVRAEAIGVKDKSRLMAPKGMIHLQARSGDLHVNSSTLDVGIHHIDDLKADQNWIFLKKDEFKGVDLPEINIEDPPSIGIYANKNINITGGSLVTASQDLTPLLEKHPSLKRSEIRLKDTAGAVVVDAGQGLAVKGSRLTADASHNFAGDVALRAKGQGDPSGLSIHRSEISADGGVGGGDIRINSASGISIVGTQLRASSHNRYEDRENRGQEVVGYSYPRGEITLTNASLDRPIIVQNSKLLALKTSSEALLLPLKFDGLQEDFLVNLGLTGDDFDRENTGGRLTLISSGGIDIKGDQTLLSVASRVPDSPLLDDFPGSMGFAVADGRQISIASNVRLDLEALQNPGREIRLTFSKNGLPKNFWEKQTPDLDLDPVKGKVRDEAFTRFDALKKSVDQAKTIVVVGSESGRPMIIDVVPPSQDPFDRSGRNPPPQSRMASGPNSALTLGLLPDGRAQEIAGLVAETVEPLSEAKAAQLFADDEQSATREVMTSLGLAMDRPRSLGIAPLQQHLRQSIDQPLRSGKQASLTDRYVPAILHLSLTPLPNSSQVQVNQILIPAEGPIRGWQTKASAAKMKKAVEIFKRRLSQLDDLEEASALGADLTSALLEPVMPEIKRLGINALLLSLDRGLQGIPFAALPWGQSTLGEQVALTVTPALSLTDLTLPTPVSLSRIVLAGTSSFGNGLAPLPMAREELVQLARLHPEAMLIMDGQFQTRSLVEAAGQGGLEILHLATHADFAQDRSGEAQVYTSDGTLSLRQIGQKLRGRRGGEIGLFVLNACRTAIGDEDQELGIAGLALQTGASSALGNLWYVDDAMSAAFSVQYHRALQRGLRKDQALQFTQGMFRRGEVRVRGADLVAADGEVLITGLSRADQLRLMKNNHHPYFWAGTILSGRPW
jgi:CHAT domain-containing protein